MNEIENLKRKLKCYLDELFHYENKTINQSQKLMKKISKIKYNSDDLKYLLEIPILEQQRYSFSCRKRIFRQNDKGNQIVNSINKIIFNINEKNTKNIIMQYKNKESEYLEVKCFLIRKLFIYYMEKLLLSLDSVNSEEIHTLKYNVDQEIVKIKEDDNWFLANNLIDDFILKNIMEPLERKGEGVPSLQDIKNETVIAMKDCEKKVEWIRLIVNLDSVDSIKRDILSNDQMHNMMNKIDNLLIDFIDFYADKDDKLIKSYFNDKEDFISIIIKLGYKYSEISEEDKLDLELCKTLDINTTKEPEKDFCISKIYRQGVLKNNSVVRKALVNIYRFEID